MNFFNFFWGEGKVGKEGDERERVFRLRSLLDVLGVFLV